RLYTPNGQLHSTLSNGIGIVEDKPAAALHIRESEHQATAFRIDIASDPMSGPPGQNNFTEPEFAFKVNRKSVIGGVMSINNLASIDGKGNMRIGQFPNGARIGGSEKLQVFRSLGIYSDNSNNISLHYGTSTPELSWKTSYNKNFRF